MKEYVGESPTVKFCEGIIFQYFKNNPTLANECYNQARHAKEWKIKATMSMINLYLNPNNESTFYQNFLANGADEENYLESVRILIEELASFVGMKSLQVQVYRAYVNIIRHNFSRASKMLQEVLNVDESFIPARLCSAILFIIENKKKAGLDILEKIQKDPYDERFSHDFEAAYLHLADLYMKAADYPKAAELCKKVLNYNQSCAQAQIKLGSIAFNASTAAEHFEVAWSLLDKSSLKTGLQLSQSFIKDKEFVEAAKVCNMLLKKFPNKGDVLTVLSAARNSFRL